MPAEQKFQQVCEKITAEMKRLKAPGLERPASSTPCASPDTLFQVGSISKTFTGTILMRIGGRLHPKTG